MRMLHFLQRPNGLGTGLQYNIGLFLSKPLIGKLPAKNFLPKSLPRPAKNQINFILGCTVSLIITIINFHKFGEEGTMMLIFYLNQSFYLFGLFPICAY